MNRLITLMLLGVVGVAMLLVFFVHMGASDGPPPTPTVIRQAPPAPEFSIAPPTEPVAGPAPVPVLAPPQEPEAVPAPQAQQASAPASQPVTSEKPRATASVTEGTGNILDLSLHFKDSGLLLRIEGDGPLPAKYFILSQPERLVVDLPGSWNGLKQPDIPSNDMVKSARIGRQGNADRLVLDLSVPVKNHKLNRISDYKVELYFAQ